VSNGNVIEIDWQYAKQIEPTAADWHSKRDFLDAFPSNRVWHTHSQNGEKLSIDANRVSDAAPNNIRVCLDDRTLGQYID
jgi:hypothetical protein